MLYDTCLLSKNLMETNRKVIKVNNYYRKSTLKRYFQIWKKYSDYNRNFANSIKIQRNSYLRSKVNYKPTYMAIYYIKLNICRYNI